MFRTQSVAEYCYEEIRRYVQNTSLPDFQCALELEKSDGLYEDDDIREIYQLQEGKCYYTGKPISLDAKDYAIDRIIPIHQGGSSWPRNLALTTKAVRQEKFEKSKRAYWHILAKKHGTAWATKQRTVCETIDKQRLKIDRRRKATVEDLISARENELIQKYPDHLIFLALADQTLTLTVGSIEVNFPRGFLRNRKTMAGGKYFSRIVRSVLSLET